jgi:hypothetical protein
MSFTAQILTATDLSQIKTNLLSATLANIPIHDITSTQFGPGLEHITIFEFWLTKYIAPDEFVNLQKEIDTTAMLTLTKDWKWDEKTRTVISPKDISTDAAFPMLNVIMKRLNKPINIAYVNPMWIVDPHAAWKLSQCDVVKWLIAKPYLDLDAVTRLDNKFIIDCKTGEITEKSTGVLVVDPHAEEKKKYTETMMQLGWKFVMVLLMIFLLAFGARFCICKAESAQKAKDDHFQSLLNHEIAPSARFS